MKYQKQKKQEIPQYQKLDDVQIDLISDRYPPFDTDVIFQLKGSHYSCTGRLISENDMEKIHWSSGSIFGRNRHSLKEVVGWSPIPGHIYAKPKEEDDE